jgi:hypothetical protein
MARRAYLPRAIDAEENLVGSMVSAPRDMDATKRFARPIIYGAGDFRAQARHHMTFAVAHVTLGPWAEPGIGVRRR